ncbi:MAG: hypothetical protein ACYDHO_02095 [Gaiellaceae bacterium]
MKKTHVALLAVLVAAAAAIGTYAATRTTELGVQARAASNDDVNAVVTARTRRLNAFEDQLRKTLAAKPPKLPSLPKIKPVPAQYQSAVRAQPAPVSQPVVSRPATTPRPATITVRRAAVRTTPVSAHSERDSESSGGEHDD